MSYLLNEVVLHHFWISVAGITLWFIVFWSIEKSRNENGFSTRKWLNRNYDEMMVSMVVALTAIVWEEEVMQLLADVFDYQIEFQNYHYFLIGPATDGLIKAVKLLKSKG